jgi:3-hydroxyacyl-[acyl-carrier-protein] dehydratase
MRFLLVDRIDGWSDEEGMRGVKNAALSEDYFEHHFPGQPVVPGALLLESLVQLAGWFEAATSEFERWLVLDSVSRCGFYGFVLPGDSVLLEVSPEEPAGSESRRFRGVGRVEGETRISAEFTGRILPLDQLDDPERTRELFDRLRRQRPW